MRYLTLRYVLGVVDTELPTAMNSAIGMQMMCAFMNLGNSFAFSFLRNAALKFDTAMRQGAKVNIQQTILSPAAAKMSLVTFQ